LVRDANRSASDVAKELGVNVNTLYNWRSLVTDKLPKKSTNDDILSENKRLKKELAQAELSAIYFYLLRSLRGGKWSFHFPIFILFMK